MSVINTEILNVKTNTLLEVLNSRRAISCKNKAYLAEDEANKDIER